MYGVDLPQSPCEGKIHATGSDAVAINATLLMPVHRCSIVAPWKGANHASPDAH
jgi:hypothetical protein